MHFGGLVEGVYSGFCAPGVQQGMHSGGTRGGTRVPTRVLLLFCRVCALGVPGYLQCSCKGVLGYILGYLPEYDHLD